jgi:hypothetical protein
VPARVDHPDLAIAIDVVRFQFEFVVGRLARVAGRGFAFIRHALQYALLTASLVANTPVDDQRREHTCFCDAIHAA